MKRFAVVLISLLALLAFVLPAAAQDGTYTVQPGDTLYSIAQRLNLDVNQLARVNGILNPSIVYVGQVLNVSPNAPVPTTYIVGPGENLTWIAQRFGIPVDVLARQNGILNPNDVRRGTTLTIDLNAPAPTTYTVGYGENLTWIAQRFGVSVADLVRINNIANPNNVRPGTVLRLVP